MLTIFVLTEFHEKGAGREIINTLEQDESVTATVFYRKFGYDYKNSVKELDEEHHEGLGKRILSRTDHGRKIRL